MSETRYVEVEYDWFHNPRDPGWCDVYSNMICFHRRYNIGDVQFNPSLKAEFDTKIYSSWEDLYLAITSTYDVVVVLPVYLLDHSGLTIRTHPFSDGWDSGQIGFIFITKEQTREVFCVKNVTKKIRQRACNLLIEDIKEYDRYLRGVELVTEDEARRIEWREICHEFKWEWIE